MTEKSKITFGTDGWRAIMGKEYTSENVALVIQAFCEVQKNAADKRVYVGFDRRAGSPDFARVVCEVLGANGFTAYLGKSFCPTPCVSWMVKKNQALAGIMITASHNPAEYNGVKFKESYGGAASPEYTDKIENVMAQIQDKPQLITRGEFAVLEKKGHIKCFDPHLEYVEHLKNYLHTNKIREAQIKFVADAMHGAGSGYMAAVLGCEVNSIRTEDSDNFGGVNPEPIAKNLAALKEAVLAKKAAVGLATDGDADRIGAMDEDGNYIDAHQIFALLLMHHLEYRKLSGLVVKSISTTQWINRIAKEHGIKVLETPIGFRHICKILNENDALMGGEESGGISLRDHVHERDGVLNGLFLLEMMAVRTKSIRELVSELRNKYGDLRFERRDYHLTPDVMPRVRTRFKEISEKDFHGCGVSGINRIDGVKVSFSDDSWLLMRASGTEPLIRVYAEANSLADVQALQELGKKVLNI